MNCDERQRRADAAGRLLALLVEARDAIDIAEVDREPGAGDALKALRAAFRWANAVALRREVLAVDDGAPLSLRRLVH